MWCGVVGLVEREVVELSELVEWFDDVEVECGIVLGGVSIYIH